MDLVSVHPIFNLYNGRWPIRGETHNLPPAKFVQGGVAEDSVVGSGCIISAGTVRNSVLSSNVIVEDGADGMRVLGDVRRLVKERFAIDHVTVQIENRSLHGTEVPTQV